MLSCVKYRIKLEHTKELLVNSLSIIQLQHMEENNILKPQTEKKENSWLELIKFALIALAIVIPIRVFVAQPFIVSGSSMFPTFENRDYLIVDEFSYHFRGPERGEVIVFRYPNDPSKFYIKRVIGLPGETVVIDGEVISIKNSLNPEGFVLDEPYIKSSSHNNITQSLGEGEYYVMGDNRNASSDSRSWGILPEKNIVGRAFIRLVPIKNASILPGKAEY